MKLHFFSRQAILLIVLSFVSTLCLAVSNPNYLCFTAEEANAKVAIKKQGEPKAVSLKFSRDLKKWFDYAPGETGYILLSNIGDKVWFRATSTNNRFNDSGDYYRFSLVGGKVAASGNVMSLLDATCQQTSVPMHAFYSLFRDSKKLTKAPELPAVLLSDDCYSEMFYGCTSLLNAPALPATQL